MLGRFIENSIRKLGKPLVSFIFRLGQLSQFIAQSLYHTVTPPFYPRLVGRQLMDIGFYSLPVVALTTIFAGMVIALQTYSGFSSYGAESAVAQVVLIAVTRELAPVFCGLMVAGRIGAAMAAEIGTMRVTEQIDALVTLSTNPFKYLVAPRLLAGELQSIDIMIGITKGAVFGFIIALMGCYNGYKSKGGAQGVGDATTNAVVASSILILIFNYIITGMFFTK